MNKSRKICRGVLMSQAKKANGKTKNVFRMLWENHIEELSNEQ